MLKPGELSCAEFWGGLRVPRLTVRPIDPGPPELPAKVLVLAAEASRARQIVRAKLDEASRNAWTASERLISGWLAASLGRYPTDVELDAGRAEFSAWWAGLVTGGRL